MRRSAAVLVLAVGGSLLAAAPAHARACQGDALGLDTVTKGMKAELGPQALRLVGETNAAVAHDLGGLHFGPVAKDLTGGCP